MVTFACPDFDSSSSPEGPPPEAVAPTPSTRPNLFASSTRNILAKTPSRIFAKGPSGTPPYYTGVLKSTPARRSMWNRNEMPPSSLKKSSVNKPYNLFPDQHPPAVSFSPRLPPSTMKKVFAPGATPEPSRVYRDLTASAAPRGLEARASDKTLFPMRISSPPRELTGEALTQKVPKDWNSKGSIYADQFLSHLCPPDLDEEQRRQFFCILDLRRLKYAANEIFARKDWKLNVINFAKEFEKSRGIILLRYGLYEFQNVKPSKEVLKRWRREHGLPDPEEEQAELPVVTPSKSAPSKKRLADDDLTKDKANAGKRLMTEKALHQQEAANPLATPQQPTGKNKRKSSREEGEEEEDQEEEDQEEEERAAKRATPSATKTLFEKIANKASETTSLPKLVANPAEAAASPAANIFASKPATGGLARSVFTNLKAGAATNEQTPAAASASNSSNIFGYLSDASSAKNSGADADAENESDSEQGPTSNASQSKEPSVAEEAPAPAAAAAAASLTRDNSPSRSLFDRVTKGSNGEPVRAAETPQSPIQPPEPADKTWNPSTTPLKFAPSATANMFAASQSAATASTLVGGAKSATTSTSLFGAAPTKTWTSLEKSGAAESASSSSSIFAPKSTAPSNIFDDKSSVAVAEANKDGSESDKENDSQPAKKTMFGAKPMASASSSVLFGSKATTTPSAETPAEPAKPTCSNLFAMAAAKPPALSHPLGDAQKTDQATSHHVAQSSTLFGAKPAEEASTKTATPPITSAPLFSGQNTAPAANLFGAASAAPSESSFASSTAPKTDAHAPASSAPVASVPATTAPPLTTAPIFGFGSNPATSLQPVSKSPFGLKSPPANNDANMFGSPMKQDEQSPAKRMLGGGSTSTSLSSTFGGGAGQAPSANLFGGFIGGNTAANGNTPVSFGFTSAPNSGSGSFGFNFSAGGSNSASSNSAGTSFNNPFSTNNGGNSNEPGASSSSSGMFNFGGGGNSSAAANGGGSTTFGGGSNAASGSSTPLFGGGATAGGAPPAFNFTAASPAPAQGAPAQGGGGSNNNNNNNMFGAGQAGSAFGNLQPPVGGSSTAGTNSPLNLGGGSSLATTPAAGTPEPGAQTAETSKDSNEEDGQEKHEQINLTEGGEVEEETTVYEIRAKVLKYKSADGQSVSDGGEVGGAKSKSPWTTKGIGPLRILQHRETKAVRLLLRAEPRGNVALNKTLLADADYKADDKYVRLTTWNEAGDGLETWMIQVKTKDMAKVLAKVLEENKVHNKE